MMEQMGTGAPMGAGRGPYPGTKKEHEMTEKQLAEAWIAEHQSEAKEFDARLMEAIEESKPHTLNPRAIRNAERVILAIGHIIRDAQRIDTTTLFLMVCDHLDAAQLAKCVARLQHAGVVERVWDTLVWRAPQARTEVH